MLLLNVMGFYFAVFIILIAIGFSLILLKIFSNYHFSVSANRFIILEGLRGYLAIAVFIHHSAVWYFYLHIGKWTETSSNFYNNLGQASVVLFFMITAFLFFNKLLGAKNNKIDWYKLYISRILRIFPLQIFVSIVTIIIILFITKFTLNEPLFDFIKNCLKFLQFKLPIINSVDSTLIESGVTWTLQWERSFYLSLPFFAFFLGLNVSLIWFLIIAILSINTTFRDYNFFLCFLGGIIASYIIKYNLFAKLFNKFIFGFFAVTCLIFELFYFKTSYYFIALIPLLIFFIAVVSDNLLLLKIFSSEFSQFLSTISYSIYLLHGIVLFAIFKFLIGFELLRLFSPLQYWLVIGAGMMIIISTSSITYYFIELPFLKLAKSKNLYKPKFIKYLSFSKIEKKL